MKNILIYILVFASFICNSQTINEINSVASTSVSAINEIASTSISKINGVSGFGGVTCTSGITYQTSYYYAIGGDAQTSLTLTYQTTTTANDIIFISTITESATLPTTPTGFAILTSSTNSVSSSVIYWKRATGSESGDVVLSGYDNGGYSAASMYAYSGCITSGNPYSDNLINTSYINSGDITFNLPSTSTSCLKTIASFALISVYSPTIPSPYNVNFTMTKDVGTEFDLYAQLIQFTVGRNNVLESVFSNFTNTVQSYQVYVFNLIPQ